MGAGCVLLCGAERCSVPVLEDIDPDKVYVLGGLVDESIHKVRGACLTLTPRLQQCECCEVLALWQL